MFLLRIFAAKNSKKRSLAFASTRNSGGSLALSVTSSTGPAKGTVQVCSAPGAIATPVILAFGNESTWVQLPPPLAVTNSPPLS